MSKGNVELLEATSSKEAIDHGHQLILFNDDVNTFEDVVAGLMTVVRMTAELAMKTAMEAHTQGKTIAHVGKKDECQKMKNQLQHEYTLTVEVEPI